MGTKRVVITCSKCGARLRRKRFCGCPDYPQPRPADFGVTVRLVRVVCVNRVIS